MKTLVTDFTRHLSEALEIGAKAKLSKAENKIEHVVITGLGGSGIGGTLVSEMVAGSGTVPVLVNKDYFLPDYVGSNSLVIVSSYSGNTEETLAAFEIALAKKAKIVIISSGGKMIEKAKQLNLDHIIIPPGMPPRACLGYSFTQLFFVLNFFGIIDNSFNKNIQDAILLLNKEEQNIQSEAKEVAQKLSGKIPVIYSTAGNEGVAIRFRQQVNENSKMLCWHHVVPEMNHNELVGWRTKDKNLAVVFFRNKEDYDRNKTRIEINKKIISEYSDTIIELNSKGNSQIERTLYQIHLGDWISVSLAEIKNIDATEVKVIDFLKGELAKK